MNGGKMNQLIQTRDLITDDRYFILLLLIDVVYSCGVCFGDPNSSAVDGRIGL